MGEKGSFWSSIPGVVTGAAGILTGVAGLAAVAVQAGWVGGDGSASDGPGVTTTSAATVGGSAGGLSTAARVDFEVDPATVDFRTLGGREAIVTIENTGSSNLSIEPVELEGDSIDAFRVDDSACEGTALVPGRRCRLVVTTTGGGLSGRATATLIIGAAETPKVSEVDLQAGGLL